MSGNKVDDSDPGGRYFGACVGQFKRGRP